MPFRSKKVWSVSLRRRLSWHCMRPLPAAILFVIASIAPCRAETAAVFFRAINLNGPEVIVQGRTWESGQGGANLQIVGKTFENQKVSLKPTTDKATTAMIRSSVWGSKVDITLSGVPRGVFQVFTYVWEDNNNERFDILVNNQPVAQGFESGTAGVWKKLGPWKCESFEGKLTISGRAASHGAANFSGVEVWSGAGPIPTSAPSSGTFADAPTPEQASFFESKIRPILVESCYECHSAGSKKIKGGLVLDSRAGVRKGGDIGPAITPGDPDASLLIEAVRHLDEDLAMPPKKKLPPDQIAALVEWVTMGAPDPREQDTLAAVQAKSAIDWEKGREWWSLQPIAVSAPPFVRDANWAWNDVDRHILAKLENARLKPSIDAEARVLIRRMTYDLHGLPPTPEEVERFIADVSRDRRAAIHKLVERLLASPRYGERWGRHWLDVVRYADTAGDNSDYPIPQMHRYRDWVIAAFNRDLPYDEFVRDQLAGDLRESANDAQRLERIVATGYIANARRFGSRVEDYPQHLTIEDTIDNVGRAFLGLTVNCARCHDHKFDPISTGDYYALYGIFNSTRYPWPGIELDKKQRDLVPLVAAFEVAQVEAARRMLEQEQSRISKKVKRNKEAIKTASGAQKEELGAQSKALERDAKAIAARPFPFEMAYAVADAAKISDATVQIKGDPAKPGSVVPRHFLTVFGGQTLPHGTKSSGREKLADWILSEKNPLAPRVMANRIWLHHFGRGIVATPNDFGKQGKPPTHPELLDYLATQFRESGWSVKEMHRLILTSRTYQIAGARTEEANRADPENALLSNYPRRRLDAEAIRDTLLAVAGNLDLSPAGAHPFPPSHEWGFTQHKPFKAVYESNRRSVYLMTQRIQRHPYLAIFDGADPSASTPVRPTSTTPTQALFLLNDPFVHSQSGRLAERISGMGLDDQTKISQAYALLFSRAPTAEEAGASLRFLKDARASVGGSDAEPEAWRSYLRALFRLNELVYLD